MENHDLTYVKTLWAEEAGVKKQKIVLATSKQTLYVSFCGSNSMEDLKIMLDISMVRVEDLSEKEKFHNGFLKTSQLCFNLLKPEVRGINHKTIVFCGHSKGAAVSALVYLLFVKEFAQDSQKQVFNITFALPPFGNIAVTDDYIIRGSIDIYFTKYYTNIREMYTLFDCIT